MDVRVLRYPARRELPEHRNDSWSCPQADAGCAQPNEKLLTTVNPAGEQVTIADCQNENSEALYVTNEIRNLVGTPFFSRSEDRTRPLTYSDIAIICRRRVDGNKFAQMLKKNGIPAEFVGEVDFFAHRLSATSRHTSVPLRIPCMPGFR